MGRRAETDTDGGDGHVVERGREDAIAWARALVAKGIHVVRLRSSKAAPPRPVLTVQTRR